eukprot:TRINITY_DN3139_c0_g2_i1.p1 TRINITY_DN3139_c0_g2~~TRINITY_DN3139_c0_g2_i1.p1  ORF type:complete len:612 (-),score=100.17 TRINITY_DN3139_c0_g2_i1:134-1903(-)
MVSPGWKATLFLLLPCRCHAEWPPKRNAPKQRVVKLQGLPPEVMLGMMPLSPVMVLDGHFGFDPFEDLHQNIHTVVTKAAAQPRRIGQGFELLPWNIDKNIKTLPELALGASLSSLFSAFGDDHHGHVGRSQGSFHVEAEKDPFFLTALLPGYNFGDTNGQGQGSASDPLHVRVVGSRSLVVSGTHKMGRITSQWQRSFALPKRSDTKKVSVTYKASDGNLTVTIPRLPPTEGSVDSEEEDNDDEDDPLMLLPPALRAMKSGMPSIIDRLEGAHGRARKSRGDGFLSPGLQLGDLMGDVFGMMDQMHPRWHAPPGGDRKIPEDAVVNLVGCFAEDQLSKTELKYYGDTNAASFKAMYWHAVNDHATYFSMARHEASLGHGLTFRAFSHEHEDPKWGKYDGCGSRCADEDERWCGCANEASRGFPNEQCPEGEKRFAVYKIGNSPATPLTNETEEGEPAADGATVPAAAAAAAARGPYWQLSNGDGGTDGGSSPTIEVVVPKGTRAHPRGRQMLLFNDTKAGDAAEADSQDSTGPTTEPVGRVKLPVNVDGDSCVVDSTREDMQGATVVKCKLSKDDVKSVPIKIVADEL